jgi:hypothetical protein
VAFLIKPDRLSRRCLDLNTLNAAGFSGIGRKREQQEGKRQQELAVDMSHRASWDWKEVCGKSIPQLEQGGKRPAGFEICSPMEGQAHRRSGAACILGIGEIRGADAPFAHAGVFGKGKRVKSWARRNPR